MGKSGQLAEVNRTLESLLKEAELVRRELAGR
jgi:hypothetical protein